MRCDQFGRRDFVKALGAATGAFAWPLGAYAQKPQIPMIGFLSSVGQGASAPLVAKFQEGMSLHGFVDRRNVFTIFSWAEGDYGKLDALARELVDQKKVKLIVASGGLVSARAAMKASSTIPILFVAGFDPVALALGASFNSPRGNATGASVITSELLAKRLALLHELKLSAESIGFLHNPAAITAKIDVEAAEDAARKRKVHLEVFKAGTEREIDSAFALAKRQGIGALLVAADPYLTSRRVQIVALAAQQAIPVMYPWGEYVKAGGLMSYGTELTWGFELIGQYAGRILKGENPGNLPVQQPTKFNLIINLKTAAALGLDLKNSAPALLTIADDLIE